VNGVNASKDFVVDEKDVIEINNEVCPIDNEICCQTTIEDSKQKGSTSLNPYALDVVDEDLDMENLDLNNADTIELSMGMVHEQFLIVQNFVHVSLSVPPPNLKDPIDNFK
jgi:hypothetical protein